MTDEPQSFRTNTDWLLALGVALVAAGVIWVVLTPSHVWGDDFAGYLMQAHAIEHGALRDELARSTHLLSLSDSKFGPPAYPWGYPAMLWLASRFVGWDIHALKVIGVLANAVLGGCLYLLARRYVSRTASAIVAAFVVLQPSLLYSGDTLSSDTPALAVNALALLVAEALPRARNNEQRLRVGLVLGASLLATAAFSIRSNGAFIAVAMFVMLAWPFFFDAAGRRRALAGEMTLLTVVTSALFLAYLRLLPDGSLAHAGYLSLAPHELLRRFVETVATCADLVPFSILRAVGLFRPVIVVAIGVVVVAVCAVGAWRHRDRASGLVVFGILNFALLLTFPDNGGARYLFPLLIPVGVLLAAGVEQLMKSRVTSREATPLAAGASGRSNVLGGSLGVASVAAIAAGLFLAFSGANRTVTNGPLTPVADSLFGFIRQEVPADVPVSFFKPRALRLYTDRMGIAITQPENLGRAGFVVVDKRDDDAKWEKTWQVDRRVIETFDNGRFEKRYENGQFIVYGAHKP